MKKFEALTDDELAQVNGGSNDRFWTKVGEELFFATGPLRNAIGSGASRYTLRG